MSALNRHPWLVAIPVIILLVVASSAFRWKDESDYFFRVNRGLEIFGQVYREVAQSYVDEVDPDRFIASGIDGMLRTLDPYTTYLNRAEASEIDVLTSGAYAGIGINVGMRDSVVTIIDVVDGYSARRQGMRIGDRILAVNGQEVLHGPVEQLRERMRGDPGTTVTITVLRDGLGQPMEFTLTREMIRVHSVGHRTLLAKGVGYIRLERFGSTAGREIRDAVADMERNGPLRGLILDLRDNPGGLLESAVDVVSTFVPVGSVIVSTRGRDPEEDRIYRSTDEPMLTGIPLIVMINENSASASEIVAGAIQDLDAGVIVGERSFGKGLVQSVRRLPYNASLKITTARYFTPSGRSIQKVDYGAQRDGRAIDTTKTMYRTAHGRLVADHGGIDPDTVLPATPLPASLDWLRERGVLFGFGTREASRMTELSDNFRLDDAALDRFEEYALEVLDRRGSGDAIAVARVLEEAIASEGLDVTNSTKVAALRNELREQKRRLMRTHRAHIRGCLEREIASRFAGHRERIVAATTDDHQIVSAAALLHTESLAYGRLLSAR